MQEFDTACEAIIVLIYISLWTIQDKDTRFSKKVVLSLASIALSMKFAYFFDEGHSMNFDVEEPFKSWKSSLMNAKWLASYLPLALYLGLESFILRDLY